MIGDRLLRQAKYELERRRKERADLIAKIDAEVDRQRKSQRAKLLEEMRAIARGRPGGRS